MMEIRRLDPQEYAGYALQFEYVTDCVYDVQADENGFSLALTRLDSPLRKAFTDTLFSEWLEEPVAFGAFDGETLAGVIEGSPEAWHNVFRISNILVQPEYRRRGIATALESTAINRELQEGHVPYCHLYTDNLASRALQQSLGLSFADKNVWWLYRK